LFSKRLNIEITIPTAEVYKIQCYSYLKTRGLKMDKWECSVCGYIYDPEIGDPEHNVAAGTSFEKLPEDWVCPVCGAPKSQFVKKE
jgi:rubredoxin